MKKKQSQNELLYVGEDLSCKNRMTDIVTGFKYIKFDKEECIEKEYTHKNYLLFFFKGDFSVCCNQFCNHTFHSNEMVVIPKSAILKVSATAKSQMLAMAFDMPQNSYDKQLFQGLSSICENISYNFNPIPIRYPLMPFLETVVHCLRNEMDCTHLHDVIERELFFLLRGFYNNEEIAVLFHPVIGRQLEFRDFVMQNYMKVNNLDSLITLSNMGRTSFFIKFKEEFGITAKQWMMKQLKKRILGKVIEPGICVKQLMEVCNFESQAQLYRYFKQHFHCTPKQLIDQYQVKTDNL
ncbi:AraC family transcriptional regulator [Bacteroides thetaiotaomicron]|uniref:helix-turn-helix domain-containing protein n=1 Tax=Bacteroides thetaiotaomicron TaxID=818 RepID=UPI0021656662|nr:AraC family transcriptional regulator [Bacteroides thetaiotaomicron]MCS2449198.1 AraC family transcriptional regulator [Bacteroides thetaiotaomicron]